MENIGRKLKHKVHFPDKQTHHKNWQFCWVSLFDIERGFFLSEQLSLQEQMRKFPNYFSTKLSSIAGEDCHKTRLRFSCFLLYFWLWFLSSADSWKGLDFLFFPLIILTLIFVRSELRKNTGCVDRWIGQSPGDQRLRTHLDSPDNFSTGSPVSIPWDSFKQN